MSHEANSIAGRCGEVVLVVDDEEQVRDFARVALERHGFTVLTASDGLEGSETFRAHAQEVGVVLLDLTMPNRSGAETLLEIRRIRPDARVVVTSGFREEEVAPGFEPGAITAFLQKPYFGQDLVAKLREVLAGEILGAMRKMV